MTAATSKGECRPTFWLAICWLVIPEGNLCFLERPLLRIKTQIPCGNDNQKAQLLKSGEGSADEHHTMHDALTALAFVVIVLSPCIAGLRICGPTDR